MTKLIVPAAGMSSRYSLAVPKFRLPHPRSGTMLEHSIASLGSEQVEAFEEIVIITLEDFFDSREEIASLEKDLQAAFPVTTINLHLLKMPTSGAVETILKFIETENADHGFVVKDSDNAMRLNLNPAVVPKNFVAFANLNVFPWVTAANKGFVELDAFGNLANIIEKVIVGPNIYVGMAGFESYSSFVEGSIAAGEGKGELYVSEVIRASLVHGKMFSAVDVSKYEDWGTLSEWQEFKSRFSTIVVQLEGTLVEARSAIAGNPELFRPLHQNIALVRTMLEDSRRNLVVATQVIDDRHLPSLVDWLRIHEITAQITLQTTLSNLEFGPHLPLEHQLRGERNDDGALRHFFDVRTRLPI